MDRFWLLTWTTYGTWLPGDVRGFVTEVRDEDGQKVRHNQSGTPCDADVPGLRRYAQCLLKCEPVLLDGTQADALLAQFQETAAYRGWGLLAAAVMPNHVHLVVGVPGDPAPYTLLQSFKAYGSRALNRLAPRPASGTWWTESGSTRRLPHHQAVRAAVRYVLRQHGPLVVWSEEGTDHGEGPGD